MKKLDKFVVKAFVGPFIAILLVVIFVLMMQSLWLYIDELVGKGLGLGVILEFMMWGGFISLPLALPLATLLASMMTVGQMAENNEMLAIRASGISFVRTNIPLLVCSVLISIGAFFAGNNLVPKAFNEIYTLRDDIGRTKNEIKIPSGTFYDGIEGYILRIEEQADTKMMHGVMVYDHTGNRGNTTLTLADSAMMKMSRNKDYLTFTLYHGANYQETNERSFRDTTLRLQRIDFDKQELVIRLDNYAFEKSDSNRFSDQTKAMNIKQLKADRDSMSAKVMSSHDAHYTQMNSSSVFMMRQQLDTSRHSDTDRLFEHEDFLKWDRYEQLANAYQEATANANRLSSDISVFNQDVFEANFILRRADIEYLKKFAQALACFILFFIGAPLGALIRKGGLGVSAIVSVLFFVLYWVIDISGTKLARDGNLDASTGAFVSAYILAPIGCYLMWKAIHDNELFNMDAVKNRWRKMTSRISGLIHPVRIVYMGTPEFAVAPLDRLVSGGYKVVGVVTVADKPSGRGLKVNESAVKQYAVQHGIPVLQPLKLKDPEFLEALRAWKADLFVVVAFRMLPEEVWGMPRLGTFNLHAALLPQYRGAAPVNWAVINGERMTGVTTFMIDKDIDTGGIMLRQESRIGPDDTVGDVHDRLMAIGADLVKETVDGIIQHNIETRVQRSFVMGSEVLKKAPKLTRELCHIDWRDTTDNVYNLIRGLSPYPAAFTEIVPLSAALYGAAGVSAALSNAAGASPSATDNKGNVAEGELLTAKVQQSNAATYDKGNAAEDELLTGKVQQNCAAADTPAATDNKGDVAAGVPPTAGASVIKAGKGTASVSPVQLKIYGAEKTDMKGLPGEILSDGKTYFAIATLDGAISIKDLQLAGKKRMDVKSFLLGFRDPCSYTCTTGTSKAEIRKAA